MDANFVLPREFTLFEYDTCSDQVTATALYERRASLQSYMKKQWLTLGFENESPCIRASDQVGILPFSDQASTHLLFVAPKGCHQNFGLGLRRFLELLAVGDSDAPLAKIPDGWQGKPAAHQFLLFLAHHYAHLLQELCRHDFRSYYRSEEGDLRSHIRGRLHVASYARRALSGKSHLLPCRWDEFTVDNWDNRILWAAARRLKQVAAAFDAQAAAWVWSPFRPLLSWFSSVADVPITPDDFHKSRLGRTSRFYREALSWARLLLQGSDVPSAGGRVPPLVLDANKAFEQFANIIVRSAMPDISWSALEQNGLDFRAGGPPISPDFLVLDSSKGVRAVGDAKYKLVVESARSSPLASESPEESVRVRIKSSDWYQLYVYMRTAKTSRGFFVVPFWSKDGDAIRWMPQGEFCVPPWGSESRVVVLCLNLLQPMKSVKDQAATQLRDWLSQS